MSSWYGAWLPLEWAIQEQSWSYNAFYYLSLEVIPSFPQYSHRTDLLHCGTGWHKWYQKSRIIGAHLRAQLSRNLKLIASLWWGKLICLIYDETCSGQLLVDSTAFLTDRIFLSHPLTTSQMVYQIPPAYRNWLRPRPHLFGYLTQTRSVSPSCKFSLGQAVSNLTLTILLKGGIINSQMVASSHLAD